MPSEQRSIAAAGNFPVRRRYEEANGKMLYTPEGKCFFSRRSHKVLFIIMLSTISAATTLMCGVLMRGLIIVSMFVCPASAAGGDKPTPVRTPDARPGRAFPTAEGF